MSTTINILPNTNIIVNGAVEYTITSGDSATKRLGHVRIIPKNDNDWIKLSMPREPSAGINEVNLDSLEFCYGQEGSHQSIKISNETLWWMFYYEHKDGDPLYTPIAPIQDTRYVSFEAYPLYNYGDIMYEAYRQNVHARARLYQAGYRFADHYTEITSVLWNLYPSDISSDGDYNITCRTEDDDATDFNTNPSPQDIDISFSSPLPQGVYLTRNTRGFAPWDNAYDWTLHIPSTVTEWIDPNFTITATEIVSGKTATLNIPIAIGQHSLQSLEIRDLASTIYTGTNSYQFKIYFSPSDADINSLVGNVVGVTPSDYSDMQYYIGTTKHTDSYGSYVDASISYVDLTKEGQLQVYVFDPNTGNRDDVYIVSEAPMPSPLTSLSIENVPIIETDPGTQRYSFRIYIDPQNGDLSNLDWDNWYTVMFTNSTCSFDSSNVHSDGTRYYIDAWIQFTNLSSTGLIGLVVKDSFNPSVYSEYIVEVIQ